MKRIVSLVLIVILVLCVGTVGVSAQGGEEKQLLYKDKFIELSGIPEYDPYNDYGGFTYYDELYYHKNEQGETDWVLFYVMENCFNPTEAVFTMNVGNRYIKWWAPAASYPYGYGVYDIANNTVHDITMTMYYGGVDDIEEVFEELEIGCELGDVNKDKTVSILDATEIQFYVAKLKEIADDDYSYIPALADVNDDGEMSITDATAIQMKLAKIEEKPTYNEDLVIRQAYAFDYDSFPEMPQGAEGIEFELLETYDNLTSPGIYFDNYDGDLFAIIKTKAQYDEVLDIYNDRFSEEFFDDKYLVVSVRYVSNIISLAPITDLRVLDNTLYIRADEENNQSSEPLPPIGQYYTSIVAVDKSLIENVTDIVRVK